jgi:outer membrane protein
MILFFPNRTGRAGRVDGYQFCQRGIAMQTCKTAFFVILICFFFLGRSANGADVAKIGFVDFQRVLDVSSAGKAARAEITRRGKTMEQNLKKKGNEIQERKRKLEQEALVMKENVREQKEREIRIAVNDLKALQKKYIDDFKTFENSLVKRIQEETLALVKEIGKKEGYLMIVEKRESGILYAPQTIDVTDRIIRKYNSQFAGKNKKSGKPVKKR